jgi:hypothetical protein
LYLSSCPSIVMSAALSVLIERSSPDGIEPVSSEECQKYSVWFLKIQSHRTYYRIGKIAYTSFDVQVSATIPYFFKVKLICSQFISNKTSSLCSRDALWVTKAERVKCLCNKQSFDVLSPSRCRKYLLCKHKEHLPQCIYLKFDFNSK